MDAYNLSSRPPKTVILDIWESLGKELQLYYYHQYMIPCLNEPNNTIIQICPEDMQKPDSKLLKSITPKTSEPPFPFLHLHKNYNLFKTIYQVINKLNQ